jgi:bacterioferritin-associated ferredoxin
MRQAVDDGACCVSQLYQALGCRPQCGKCVGYVRENLLNSADSAASGATA